MHIIIQHKHLLVKRRIIRKNACRIIPDMKAVCHGFHCDCFFFIRYDPVKLCTGKHFTERSFYKIDLFQALFCLLHSSAFAKDPWNEFKLRHIFFSIFHLIIYSVSNKIKSCHSKTFFIDSIVIKRIISRYVSHTYDCIMAGKFLHMPKLKYIISRCDGDLISIREFIIQCSSEVKVLCLISCCCTHKLFSFLLFYLFCLLKFICSRFLVFHSVPAEPLPAW